MKKRKSKLYICTLLIILVVSSIGTVDAGAQDTGEWKILLDQTYLSAAVVSERPVTLTAELRNAENRRIYGQEFVYQVTTGAEFAEIKDDNLLLVTAPGAFTVRAELADMPSVFVEHHCMSYALSFNQIAITNRFDNITVYTQPILLQGTIDITGIAMPADVHYELVYSVVSGPAEIYCDEFLRITGKGEVVINAASAYNSTVNVQKSFTVTDPDEANLAADLTEALNQSQSPGCASTAPLSVWHIIGISCILLLAKLRLIF